MTASVSASTAQGGGGGGREKTHEKFPHEKAHENDVSGGVAGSSGASAGAGPMAENQRSNCHYLLIVDDSTMNRKMLCKLLENRGHKCEQAKDGKEAVEKIKAMLLAASAAAAGSAMTSASTSSSTAATVNLGGDNHKSGGGVKGADPNSSNSNQSNRSSNSNSNINRVLAAAAAARGYDAILMDFVMPVMDGPTATKAIRELGFTRPIFGVTGNALKSDIDYFLVCGANRVFTKPLDVDAFLSAMGSGLP
jgi:CheY-like chemotaxis protein